MILKALDKNGSGSMKRIIYAINFAISQRVDIISTFLNGEYKTLSGTSMAVPHVTGALALLIEWSKKEFGRKLTEAELYGQLIKNTDTLPMLRTLQGNGFLFINPKNILK